MLLGCSLCSLLQDLRISVAGVTPTPRIRVSAMLRSLVVGISGVGGTFNVMKIDHLIRWCKYTNERASTHACKHTHTEHSAM